MSVSMELNPPLLAAPCANLLASTCATKDPEAVAQNP